MALALVMAIAIPFTGCSAKKESGSAQSSAASQASAESAVSAETSSQDEMPTEKNGEIMILYTSDVHCGVNEGFGYAGLAAVRENLEKQGYTTILVDDGDSV